jgi:hypothetical protein
LSEELNTALLAVKSGKAAGFDGVYPEFIKILAKGPKNGPLPFLTIF